MSSVRKRRTTKRKRTSIRRVRGRGGYFSDLGHNILVGGGSALGGAGGALLGGPLGGVVGGAAGGAAGKSIAEALGMGAYVLRRNSLVGIDEGNAVPSFGAMSNATRVRHREFITDILATGSSAFSLASTLNLNPGLGSVFPWLSGIATNYQQYEINGMIFEFVSTCSDAPSGVIGMGSIILATDYDAVDAAFSSKLQMENSQYCTSAKPTVNQTHIIECAPSRTADPVKYIRAANVGANQDIRFYDHGLFQIALAGVPAAITAGTVLGELWVTYDISLMKPQLSGGLIGQDLLFDYFQGSTASLAAISNTGVSNNIFGSTTATPTRVSGTIQGTISNQRYTFPATIYQGTFLIWIKWQGTQTNITGNFFDPVGQGGNIIDPSYGNRTFIRPSTGDTVTSYQLFRIFQVVAPGSTQAYVQLNISSAGTLLPASPTSFDLLVTQVNNAF